MGLGISIAVGDPPVVDAELGGAAAAVEVHERLGETTTFSIRFSIDVRDGDITWLADERLDPGSVISILVPVDGETECLVKGPVTGHEIQLRHGGGGSWLEVRGADRSVEMDREVKFAAWEGTDSDAVTAIAGSYGFAADDITATAGAHEEAKHTLIQRDSDLRFVRRLARRNGLSFWVTADAEGTESAHFRRPSDDAPDEDQKLVLNLAARNIQALDIKLDVERPTSTSGTQLDLNTKQDISGATAVTPQAALGAMSLQAITGDTRSAWVAAPADDSGDLQARSEGALVEADWFIRASCETTLKAMGSVVRAHTFVVIDGAGKRHSGTYLVSSVRHALSASDHTMAIDLLRNGWEA